MTRVWVGMAVAVGMMWCGRGAKADAPKCPPPVSAIHIADGSYEAQEGVMFALRGFSGHLIPRGKRAPFCYLKYTQLERGEIFVSSESLSKIFASRLEDANSPVHDLRVETAEGSAKIRGVMQKVVPVHFSIEGPVSTDGTGLSIEAQKVSAEGIPVKLLLEMVGKRLSSLMGGQDMDGVVVSGNTLTFLPAKLAQLRGHIVSASATPAGLTLRYGAAKR